MLARNLILVMNVPVIVPLKWLQDKQIGIISDDDDSIEMSSSSAFDSSPVECGGYFFIILNFSSLVMIPSFFKLLIWAYYLIQHFCFSQFLQRSSFQFMVLMDKKL